MLQLTLIGYIYSLLVIYLSGDHIMLDFVGLLLLNKKVLMSLNEMTVISPKVL